MNAAIELIRSNCPRDCYDGCGIIVEKIDGRISRVLGDPGHGVSRGRLCTKCATAYNGVWLDPAARLLYPMQRVGAKGSGQFKRLAWDKALARIAAELQRILEASGPEAILHTHYSGTLSLIALLFPMRFFYRLGASEVATDTICNAAGHQALRLVFGESYMGFDPRTIKDTTCVLVWGANPSHSGPHTHKHWFAESVAGKIVVDPLRTDTAAAADLHLQLRPGTDAALAFSLLHVLHKRGSFDQSFIDKNTLGANEMLPLLEPCTAQWGENMTGVPAAKIEEAAALYAAGPALLFAGQALQRQTTGGNTMRAVAMLPALTGNIGKPGTGFCYLNMTPAIAGLDMDALEGASLADHAPDRISYMDFAARLAKPGRYKSLFVWNTNPAASAPNQRLLREALAREDLFTVVIDCFQTDTADYADIILPAASFLEFDDLTFSYFHLNIGVQSAVQQPMGESLPNQEIFRRLAGAMGYSEAPLFETDEQLIATALQQMSVEDGFRGLQERGWQPISETPMIFWEALQFPTPSGRIEIASDQAEQQGLPRLAQPWADKPAAAGWFRLLTPASALRMNDSYANDPGLAARAGAAEVFVHPGDAESLSVHTGDSIRLQNETGALVLKARVEALAPAGTLVAYKGRWPKLESGGYNPNVLFAGAKADMAESTTVHSTLVEVTRC